MCFSFCTHFWALQLTNRSYLFTDAVVLTRIKSSLNLWRDFLKITAREGRQSGVQGMFAQRLFYWLLVLTKVCRPVCGTLDSRSCPNIVWAHSCTVRLLQGGPHRYPWLFSSGTAVSCAGALLFLFSLICPFSNPSQLAEKSSLCLQTLPLNVNAWLWGSGNMLQGLCDWMGYF